MTGFLVFGGFMFWGLFAVVTGLLLMAVGNTRPGVALWPTAGLIYLLGWAATGVPLPDWGFWGWVGAVMAYFATGAVYSLAAWWVMVRKIRAFVDDFIGGKSDLERALYSRWPADARTGNYGTVSLPPRPSEHTTRITNWVMYWPIAFVAYMVGDRLYNAAVYIYKSLAGLMSRISASAFDGYENKE